jgi:hypothetical protein
MTDTQKDAAKFAVIGGGVGAITGLAQAGLDAARYGAVYLSAADAAADEERKMLEELNEARITPNPIPWRRR